jgi:hypothetical protein
MADPTPTTPDPIAAAQQQAAQFAAAGQKTLNDKDKNAGRSAASLKKAKANLRDANKKETTFNLVLPGHVIWCSGKTVQVDSSFGWYQGTYFLDKVIHKVGRSGYTCTVDGHKRLKGY